MSFYVFNLQGDLEKQGQLLLQGPLVCSDKLPSGANFKGRQLQVFLFERVLIFSQTNGKQDPYTRYKYINHMEVRN